jgi:hypothetical protein
MKPCVSSACSGASKVNANPPSSGFFYEKFPGRSADEGLQVYCHEDVYIRNSRFNKHRHFLWTTDKIVAKSKL